MLIRSLIPALLVSLVMAQTAAAVIIPNSITGRFIRVNNTRSVATGDHELHLGEIRALLGPETDFALSSKGASASTVHGGGGHGADANLISGVVNTGGGTYSRESALTSPGVYEAEALVDLGGTVGVHAIELLQRGDGCCQSRLQNVTVTFENPLGTVLATQFFSGTRPFSTTMILAPGQTIEPGGAGAIGTELVGSSGRFIRVQNNDGPSRALHTSEIEGFAPGVTPNNNAAPSTNDITGTSFQSQRGSGGHGSVNSVFDGNLETGGATWTRSAAQANYMLDLGSTQDVATARVWQRADGCCQDRLRDFTVSIFADDGSGDPGVLMASQSWSGNAPTNSYAELTFANAFTIGADDILNIEIDPAAGLADLLTVGALGLGALTIDPGATLNVSLLGAADSGHFNVLDFGSLTGTFSAVNLAPLPSGAAWDASELYTTGILTIVPEPATIALWSLLGLCWAGLSTWRRRRGGLVELTHARQAWPEESRTAIRKMLDRNLGK